MFIFVGVPLIYCIAAIPLVLFLIYITIYSSLLMKSIELCTKRPIQSWVAELYEPFYFFGNPQKMSYLVTTEEGLKNEGTDLTGYKKKVRFKENLFRDFDVVCFFIDSRDGFGNEIVIVRSFAMVVQISC